MHLNLFYRKYFIINMNLFLIKHNIKISDWLQWSCRLSLWTYVTLHSKIHHQSPLLLLFLSVWVDLLVWFFLHFLKFKFNLPTYSITANAHPIKCPPQCPSPSYPIPHPPSLPLPLVCFPELGVSHVLSPSLIFPLIFSPFFFFFWFSFPH